MKNYDDDHTIYYISNYTNKKEFLNFNIFNIVYKEHGNNKTNLLLTSPQISQITSNIHNAKDILIYLLNNYLRILKRCSDFEDYKYFEKGCKPILLLLLLLLFSSPFLSVLADGDLNSWQWRRQRRC